MLEGFDSSRFGHICSLEALRRLPNDARRLPDGAKCLHGSFQDPRIELIEWQGCPGELRMS